MDQSTRRKIFSLPPLEKIKREIMEKEKDPKLLKFLEYSLEKEGKANLDKLRIRRANAAYRLAQIEAAKRIADPPEPKLPPYMVSEDLKLSKNYILLKSYVESSVIPPIQDSWLHNILAKIPKRLKSGKEVGLKQVLLEVRENYFESLKKSLARQTLKKPDLPQLVNDDLLPVPEEPKNINFSKPWHKDYVKHRKELVSRLKILYPHMLKILDSCQRQFSQIRLTDVKSYRNMGAVDFENLRTAVQQEVSSNVEILMQKWLPKLFLLFSEKNSLPALRNDQLESFFNCVSTLLSIQIKRFLQRNLEEWVELFDEEHTERLPVLKMYLTYEDQKVQFYPSAEDLEELILFISDQITSALQQIPTVQSWLNTSTGPTYVDTRLPPHVLDPVRAKLQAAVRRYLEAPYRFLDEVFVKPYSFLLDGSEAKRVDEFLNSEQEFRAYCEYTEKLHSIGHEVMTLQNAEYFDLIRLDCEDVKVGLSKECRRLANSLLERIVFDFKRNNYEICACFEEMRDRCRAVPQNSEELIDMVRFMEEARCQGMVRMESKISWSREYLDYLLDVYLFTPEDIAQISAVFTWKSRIQPEFDENDKLQERMRTVGEEAVMAHREKLTTELNRLRNRVDEFNDYGEIDSEMQNQYVQDVRAVLKRLMDAENERAWINKEENLYKLQVTNYPDIEEIRNLAEPFQRLFSVVVKYSKSERRWLHGEFDKLNAEAIEAELDEYWRELFKLQKLFADRVKKMRMELDERRRNQKKRRRDEARAAAEEGKDPEAAAAVEAVAVAEQELEDVKPPAALDIIKKIQAQMKSFKEIIPTIGVLCNPGIRKRHWEQMSLIAGQDLTPDSGTSLAKMLQLNLDQYMEEFASISAGASKEFTLETNMKRMRDDWNEVAFGLTAYRETGVSILASIDDIQQMLDDQIVKTQTMRGSPFIKPFEVEIKQWEERLLYIQETIDEWLKMQAQWLYLEPIFGSEDIMQQMPEEGRLFQVVDRNWKDIMRNTVKDPNVLKVSEG
ncbi:unnamed protein product [Dicrocoelium dendriticum]|nr:unnamed protein product [Dicrocoelium dendriticum]